MPGPSSAGIDEANAVTVAGSCSVADRRRQGYSYGLAFYKVLTGGPDDRGYNLSPGFARAPPLRQAPADGHDGSVAGDLHGLPPEVTRSAEAGQRPLAPI